MGNYRGCHDDLYGSQSSLIRKLGGSVFHPGLSDGLHVNAFHELLDELLDPVNVLDAFPVTVMTVER